MNKNDMTTTGIAIRSLELATILLDGILRGETMNHTTLTLNAVEELARLEKALSRVKCEYAQGSKTFLEMTIESNNNLPKKSLDDYKGSGVYFSSSNENTLGK